MKLPIDPFFFDLSWQHKNQKSQKVCGDVFVSKKIESDNRIIMVLSDGMGHGIKANVLATLTSTMALNFASRYKDPEKIADILLSVLPICDKRNMSYSTLSIIDIELDAKVTLLELGNPNCIVLRAGENCKLDFHEIAHSGKLERKEHFTCSSFTPLLDDRIILLSDGITRSGMGTSKYPNGWGIDGVLRLIKKQLQQNPSISSTQLASSIVNRAYQNDNFNSKDDASCVCVYFRSPRKLLLCTGPPFENENDLVLGEKVGGFNGKKIICGATTAKIISRELSLDINDSFDITEPQNHDPELPPVSFMKDIDLVTEGILTLSKVSRLLNNFDAAFKIGNGPAHQIIQHFLDSDEIEFNIGTRINIAHQDPNLPVDLEIRRTVVKRIAHSLKYKLMKEVKISYV